MQNSQFNQCPQPNRHIVAKDLNAPIRAVRDQRKNRVVHTSHRNGRTSTIVRMVDSRSPVRLDRWILWLSQCGQLLVMGPLSHRLGSFTVIVSGWSAFICLVWHSCKLFIDELKRNPMRIVSPFLWKSAKPCTSRASLSRSISARIAFHSHASHIGSRRLSVRP
jgi:hypothetical protein